MHAGSGRFPSADVASELSNPSSSPSFMQTISIRLAKTENPSGRFEKVLDASSAPLALSHFELRRSHAPTHFGRLKIVKWKILLEGSRRFWTPRQHLSLSLSELRRSPCTNSIRTFRPASFLSKFGAGASRRSGPRSGDSAPARKVRQTDGHSSIRIVD